MSNASPSVEFSSYFWPNEIELCLIRSATGDNGKEVLSHFNRWVGGYGFVPSKMTANQVLPHVYDSLEGGSKKLLPLVYSNFRRLQIEHPIVDQFASLYRYTTYRNRMLEGQMDLILEQLDNIRMPYYIRKGLAYLPLYYKDYGARPTSDIDIVLNPEHINSFLSARSLEGWQTKAHWNSRPINNWLYHAITLKKHHFELDVHWRFGHHPIDQSWNQLIMDSAIARGKITTLPNEYHLIDSLVHGYRYNQVRPIRWVCDVHKIMSSGRVDWNLIIDFAEGCDDRIPILSGLKFLQKEGLGEVPDFVVIKLASIPTKSSVANYYKRVSSDTKKHKKLKGLLTALFYARSCSKNSLEALVKLIRHYRQAWDQPSTFHVLLIGSLIFLEKMMFQRVIFLKKIRSK